MTPKATSSQVNPLTMSKMDQAVASGLADDAGDVSRDTLLIQRLPLTKSRLMLRDAKPTLHAHTKSW